MLEGWLFELYQWIFWRGTKERLYRERERLETLSERMGAFKMEIPRV